jgi:hypothetical protein
MPARRTSTAFAAAAKAAATAVAAMPVSVGRVAVPKLQHALLLNRFFARQLGADRLSDLLGKLRDVRGGTDVDGLTHWYHTLQRLDGLTLPGGAERLAEYDRRVTGYVERLNQTRANPRIALTYYQWLALVFTEMFLDRLFNDGAALLAELNAAAAKLNAGEAVADLQTAYTGRGGWQYPTYASEADLRKVAFWMATGSGKTVLMHVHLWQWRHYAKPTTEGAGVLLITPNEGLSRQHLAEFRASGIAAARYEDVTAGGLLAYASADPPVVVIEITKLTDKKRGGGVSVNVAEFESIGLVAVDEGHRGATGEEWRKLRGAVGKNALTIEYSATFGQVVNGATAAKKPPLLSEYAAAILFDYSYPHFYGDGYGKDYAILNTADATETTGDWVLLANLLSFYEQVRAYAADPDALRPYNVERPLWVFVGHSVTGGSSLTADDKETLTDVQTVAGFFARFLAGRAEWAGRIEKAFAGDHPLKAGGADLLERRFRHVRALGRSGDELWADIARVVFRTEGTGAASAAALRAVELKRGSGEIGLRAGDDTPYFAVVNIGDVAGLLKLFKAQGIPVGEDAVGAGLFATINKPDSPVNVLIGSRKFMEGWDSFRVASMGLLNIGQGEGSQIIQLFGRGVRLRGKNYGLKRSSALRGDAAVPPPPAELPLLETLNVFGVKAAYMAKFRDSLRNEGIDTDFEEIEVPIRLAGAALSKGLRVLRLASLFAEVVPLALEPTITVNLDLRPKVEAAHGRGGAAGGNGAAGAAPVEITDKAAGLDHAAVLRKFAPLYDWDRITVACMNFRRDKGLVNLAFDTAGLRAILDGATVTVQAVAGHFAPDKAAGLSRLEEVAVTVLTSYMATYHERRRKEWETRNLTLQPLTADDPNLAFGKYTVKVSTEEAGLAARVAKIVADAADLYARDLAEAEGLPSVYFDPHLYQPLLVDADKLTIKPKGLEPSEVAFVKDLRDYLKVHPEVLAGRELFLLRNQVSGGVVFYDEAGAGFYPDFLLWLADADGGGQTLVFVDPHGIGREPMDGAKVKLHVRLRDEITPRLRALHPSTPTRLDAFILAPTPFAADARLRTDYQKADLERDHILFQRTDQGEPTTAYIGQMFAMLG